MPLRQKSYGGLPYVMVQPAETCEVVAVQHCLTTQEGQCLDGRDETERSLEIICRLTNAFHTLKRYWSDRY